MDARHVYEELKSFCEANADERIVAKYSRYFREGFDAYGVSSELIQDKVKEVVSRDGFGLDQSLEVAQFLIPTGKYEETSLACLLTRQFRKEFTRDTFKTIEDWFRLGINNWGHTDYICGELTPFFLEKGLIGLNDFAAWRTARNKFQRRAVPVSFIKPFKKGWSLPEMLIFIEPLMMDEERVVHQGLGWFLRECWKKQAEIVEPFLHYYKNDSARLIFQYATEKMSREYRLQFRRDRKTKA